MRAFPWWSLPSAFMTAPTWGVYQVGSRLLELGVIQGRDMTTEAAMTKLMWAIGQNMAPEEIRAVFARSLAGEIAEE